MGDLCHRPGFEFEDPMRGYEVTIQPLMVRKPVGWAGIVAPAMQEQRPGWEDGRTKKGACRVADSLSECAEAMRPSPSSRVWVALSQRLSLVASR